MRKITDVPYGELSGQKLDIYLPDSGIFSVFVYFHDGGLETGDKSECEKNLS